MTSERIVVFDVETTGLDAKKHEIIQLAAIAARLPDWKVIEELEIKIAFDQAAASPEALAINHYDASEWAEWAVPKSEAIAIIGDFLRRHSTVTKTSRAGRPYKVAALCAHNAPFDTAFLFELFASSGSFCPAATGDALDTVQLSRWLALSQDGAKGPSNHKLATLCAHHGIDPGNAHDALADARATVILANKLTAKIRA